MLYNIIGNSIFSPGPVGAGLPALGLSESRCIGISTAPVPIHRHPRLGGIWRVSLILKFTIIDTNTINIEKYSGLTHFRVLTRQGPAKSLTYGEVMPPFRKRFINSTYLAGQKAIWVPLLLHGKNPQTP